MGGACSADGEERGVYRVLVGKPEVKRPLQRPRRRWEDNVSMDIQEVGCGGMDLYAPHNDVSVNDAPHIRRWSHKSMIL
jgi:hypothetical protein